VAFRHAQADEPDVRYLPSKAFSLQANPPRYPRRKPLQGGVPAWILATGSDRKAGARQQFPGKFRIISQPVDRR